MIIARNPTLSPNVIILTLMNKSFIHFLLIVFIATLLPGTGLVHAQTNPTATPSPETPIPAAPSVDLPLCKPGVYLLTPVDCLLQGPARVLTDLAKQGLSLPLKPLAASKPDPALVALDTKYAKLNLTYPQQATFYPNVESAEAAINWIRQLPPGELQYLSYKNATVFNKHNYIITEKGEWVRASPTRYSSFQGLLFDRLPGNDFGWIVDAVNPRIAPNSSAKTLPEKLARETVVQIYDRTLVGNVNWYMIGLGQWVEERYIRIVDTKSAAPNGIDKNRWIEVNLLQQTLTVHDEGKLIFATLIATGVEPYYTRPGLFKITEKKPLETMTGSFASGKVDYYYLQDVPWTMYFDQKRALHGAYWRAMYGYPQSHGCVNMSIGDAHWLYDWAQVGDWVYVWDPSNRTPTDPAFYGAGGA